LLQLPPSPCRPSSCSSLRRHVLLPSQMTQTELQIIDDWRPAA
jgi:hypothetical protein